jgi:D-threo-aldose 1-dehydrogenase
VNGDSKRTPAVAGAVTSAVILLHRDDNVVVCRRAVAAGERIVIDGDGGELIAASDVELGHKLARVRIAEYAKVIKYGAPIGSMTKAAEAGEWVHLHNMKSDYMSAHTRAATGEKQ